MNAESYGRDLDQQANNVQDDVCNGSESKVKIDQDVYNKTQDFIRK